MAINNFPMVFLRFGMEKRTHLPASSGSSLGRERPRRSGPFPVAPPSEAWL